MASISAQVSLYPLRQPTLTPTIQKALEVFRAHELEVSPGSMSTLVSGPDEAVFHALEETFRLSAEQGAVVMVVTLSNACPLPQPADESVVYHPIGHVQNEFEQPTSPDRLRASESRIVLDPSFIDGVEGLEPGQTILVLFFLHRAHGYSLLQHPQGDRTRTPRGVFALRSPNRPNAIGATRVKLLAREGNMLVVEGLDALNGSPVLDIKPD